MLGADLVAERLEQAAQQSLAAPAGNDGEPGDEGQGPIDQVWPVLASTGERRPEHPRDGDAHERGRDVGTVVHVGVQCPVAVAAAAHEADRIDVQQEGRRAAFGRRLRIEDVRLSERQLDLLHARRVLVQQESEVGGGLGGRCDGEKHLVLSAR